MKRLEGKVALISGGARGIGATTARVFVQEGARVVIGDLLDAEGQALARELGDAVRFVHLDVTQPAQWDAAVALALAGFGKLDVLLNNAGIAQGAPIEDFSHEDWNRLIGINLTGTFNGIKAVIAPMKQAGGGAIVNLASIAGLRGFPNLAAYVSSKFGVTGLTKSVALDLAPYKIRVNSVHPGLTATPILAPLPSLPTLPIPMHRAADPVEIARLIAFVASDEASFSTGAEFVADGGENAGHPVDMDLSM